MRLLGPRRAAELELICCRFVENSFTRSALARCVCRIEAPGVGGGGGARVMHRVA